MEAQQDRAIDFTKHKFPIDNFVECTNVDGKTKLHTYRWPASEEGKQPKGVIMMFHGYGSYIGKYAYMARMFVDSGYEVCGIDCMGFGLSEGVRGLIRSQDEFYRDGANFAHKALEFYAGRFGGDVPVVGWGLSQGGKLVLGVQTLLQQEGGRGFDALVLNVPNLKVQVGHLSEEFLRDARERGDADPLATIDWPFKPLKDAAFLAGFVSDPLQFKGPHLAHTWFHNIEIQDWIKAHYKEIRAPTLLVQARDDSVLENAPMDQMMAAIGAERKETKVYDGDHFLLFDGLAYEAIIRDQIYFLERVFATQA